MGKAAGSCDSMEWLRSLPLVQVNDTKTFGRDCELERPNNNKSS